MRWELALLLASTYALSLWLMVRLARSGRTRLEKVGGFLVLAFPLIGPLLYWFVQYEVSPQPPWLRNRGPRGDYTHRCISLRSDLEKKRDPNADERP